MKALPTIRLDSLTIEPSTLGSQGNAVLGIRGSGKTFTATVLAEQLHDAGIPFVAFDPIGVWRFLRVAGAGKGYPVVVAGGQDGDLPLTVASAPEIVRAAMANGVSLVIDLFDINLSKADWKRIVTSCVRVLLHENAQHGLRHVFIEEAAEFAPQRVGPDQGQVYAEIEKLARMGGNSRLGYTLINQRAEEVNKAVLELCDNLFLHRQKGRNSLTALSKWLDVGNAENGKEIIASMATLPTGQCWAWLGEADRPVLIKVPPKNSLHPDRQVMRADSSAEKKPPVNVDKFVEKMMGSLQATVAEADANDPVKLKARIRELEKTVSSFAASDEVQKMNTAAEQRGYDRGKTAGIAVGLARAQRALQDLRIPEIEGEGDPRIVSSEPISAGLVVFSDRASSRRQTAERAKNLLASQRLEALAAAPRRETVSKQESLQQFRKHVSEPGASGVTSFTGAQMKVLRAIGMWKALGKEAPTKPMVAMIAGYSHSSGGFGNLLGQLRSAGAIDYPVPGTIRLLSDVAAMPASEAQSAFLDKLSGPQRKVVDALEHAGELSKKALGEATGYSPTSGGFGNILGQLRTLGIIDYPSPGQVAMEGWVFDIL